MSCLASLPDEVLKLVMKHVSLEDRLTSCCLVNSRLHAAAVAATQDLQLSFGDGFGKRTRHPECCFQWLSQYGEHLTCLEMRRLPLTLQQLPCPNLLELSLNYTPSVQLGPAADGSPGVIQGCTKLTKLELLRSHDVSAQGGVMDSLSSLIHLQNLDVRLEDECALSSATLPRMQHLTYLAADNLSDENLLQLGALTSLQVFCLLEDTVSTVPVGPGSVPGLAFPASLTELALWSPVETGILSVVPTGLQDLWIECEILGPTEGPGSFLSGMTRLQQLTHLRVYSQWDTHVWPPAGVAYSALTLSRSLQALLLHGLQLPQSVWQHVFPSTHKLSHLTHLAVEYSHEWGAPPLPSAWGAADVSSLVSCCPNLCTVQLTLQSGPHVSELQKLQHLTYLDIDPCTGSTTTLQQSLMGLAAVTQLRHLSLVLDNEDLSAASLLPLTSLTALTYLKGRMPGLDGSRLVLDYRSTQTNSSPNVWLQLLERCAEEPGCPPIALRNMAVQLADQRAVVSQQQQQLSDQQHSVTAQEQLAAAQLQQIATLQAQMSVQQDAAAQQAALYQGLLAGLQAQMQELRAEVQQLRQQQLLRQQQQLRQQ